MPARDQILRAGLARHQQDAQLRQIALDGGEQRRHATHDSDAIAFQVIGQIAADEARARLARHQRGARDQRDP